MSQNHQLVGTGNARYAKRGIAKVEDSYSEEENDDGYYFGDNGGQDSPTNNLIPLGDKKEQKGRKVRFSGSENSSSNPSDEEDDTSY